MTEMLPTLINSRWNLLLPEHRHARPEWPWWEAQRLAAEHEVLRGYSSAALSMRWPERPLVYCVGAEEGDFPALYASWGANVVLFEPNERVWPNIKAIFEANRLEDRVGATFDGFAGNDSTWESRPGRGVWPPCADGPVIGDHGFCNLWERPDIEVMQIDEMAGAHRIGDGLSLMPDIITIDVEGAELEVLRGAQATLNQHKPVVFVSIHPTFMMGGYGHTPEMLHLYMEQAGYESRFLCEDHEQHWFFQHPDNRRMRLE